MIAFHLEEPCAAECEFRVYYICDSHNIVAHRLYARINADSGFCSRSVSEGGYAEFPVFIGKAVNRVFHTLQIFADNNLVADRQTV